MKNILIISFLFCINFINAQTGIFYYDASDNIHPNTQIIDIKESTTGDIFLLGKSNDSAFQNSIPLLILQKISNL